jgi:Ca-activated chloride channel family protein
MTATRLSSFLINVLLVLAVADAPSGISQRAAGSSSVGDADVKLTLTITDRRGRYVTALTREQITVLDEKVPQETTFFEQTNQPSSIALVFDMSRDNYAQLLAPTKRAFLDFAAKSETQHEYFIVGFDKDAYPAADRAQTPVQLAAAFDRLARIKPTNKFVLYDALSAAMDKVRGGAYAKHVIILISDGGDSGSKLGRAEVLEQLKRHDALVYALSANIGERGFHYAPDQSTLNKLCSISGGFASYPRTGAEFDEFFERLSVELKNQYTVGFIPRDAVSGWRRLDFKAKTLELKKTASSKDVEKIPLSVRSREGYYRSP